LSGGDIGVVFHQKFNFGVSSNLYYQKYSSSGIQTWEVPTQLADKGTAYNAFYSPAQDGDVIYYGYSGATGTRFDSYVQRINPDGTIPWGINGIDFDTNTTNYEVDTKIAFAAGSSYVWAIARYTPSTQDIYGEYVQKFDKVTGARQFTDNAKEVFAIDTNYRNHIGDMYLQDDAPLFIVKSGFDSGASPITLNAVLLDVNGDFAWENDLLPVATFAATKGRITFNQPVNGQGVIVFTEQKTEGQTKIYAQNFVSSVLATNGFETEGKTVKVYPNPSNGIFNISSGAAIQSVAVYNLQGQLVYENKLVGALETAVDSGSWAKGMYFLDILADNGKRQAVKFIKAD